ncbi:unnamed protein product, partial [Arabidopsis halleri]
QKDRTLVFGGQAERLWIKIFSYEFSNSLGGEENENNTTKKPRGCQTWHLLSPLL